MSDSIDEPNDEILAAIFRELRANAVKEVAFVNWCREYLPSWQGFSVKAARARVRQWRNDDDSHHYPVVALEGAVRVLRHARFLHGLIGLGAMLEEQDRLGAQRREPAPRRRTA